MVPPAHPLLMRPSDAQPIPAQPIPAQPQPQPSLRPGEAALLVPANPTVSEARPANADRPDAGKAELEPRTLTARTLPLGFKAKVEAGLHESGWPLVIVGDRDSGPMVLVPGGTFTMGSDTGGPGEAPAHIVRMSTFYIDAHEVTTGQFRTFLEETKYRGSPPGKWLTDEKARDQSAAAPAVFVNWRDAEAFALWAGKRLPTEAQWEMAARSTDNRRWPWGDQPAAWSRPRKFRQVDPVMSFPEDVSPYGVFDMAGNVMEWARDWFDPKGFAKFRDKVVDDPTGPAAASLKSIKRVVKGGSKDWYVFARQGVDLDARLPDLGFRCTVAVEGPEASAGIAPRPAKPAGSAVPF
jgi:formylglycine-generating enzyme required for sulfatase activity